MRLDYTGIAQREEQQIFNLKVIGSSPIIRTKRQVQQDMRHRAPPRKTDAVGQRGNLPCYMWLVVQR